MWHDGDVVHISGRKSDNISVFNCLKKVIASADGLKHAIICDTNMQYIEGWSDNGSLIARELINSAAANNKACREGQHRVSRLKDDACISTNIEFKKESGDKIMMPDQNPCADQEENIHQLSQWCCR